MEPFLILSGNGQWNRARRPRLPLDTGPTVDERAAAAEAAKAWLETKSARDALRREAARERIRQRHELVGQLRKSTTVASPRLSSQQYDAFLDNVQRNTLQTQVPAGGGLAPEHPNLRPLLLHGESGLSEEAPSLNSPSSRQESSGRSRRSTTESSRLSRRSTTEFLGYDEAAAVETLKYRLLQDDPLSEAEGAETVEAAVAAVVAAKETPKAITPPLRVRTCIALRFAESCSLSLQLRDVCSAPRRVGRGHSATQ